MNWSRAHSTSKLLFRWRSWSIFFQKRRDPFIIFRGLFASYTFKSANVIPYHADRRIMANGTYSGGRPRVQNAEITFI
ncbi:unnamed protein product, partial [Iphiclides podalirius]